MEEIRATRAGAASAELKLGVQLEQERDRLAGRGVNRILNVNTPIAGDYADAYIGALDHWGRRDYDNEKPITINISSPGGSVMDGLALFDTILKLRRQGVVVTTRAAGLVASMATILLQAGTERVADKNVQILVHEVSGGAGGKISAISDEAAFMERLNARLLAILAERSTLSARAIKSKSSRREWWIDADEALKLGFVDRVE